MDADMSHHVPLYKINNKNLKEIRDRSIEREREREREREKEREREREREKEKEREEHVK
jgi:hypothetical protein